MVDGRPRFLTALGTTDSPQGWRQDKLRGGVLLDIETGEVVLVGPLDAAFAALGGRQAFPAQLGGLRAAGGRPAARHQRGGGAPPRIRQGLAAAGDFLFIGLSHLRHDHRVFGDLPIASAEGLFCGLLCIHLPTGRIAGELRYLRTCKEIYDVQVLPGRLRPGILGPDDKQARLALAVPGLATWAEERPEEI